MIVVANVKHLPGGYAGGAVPLYRGVVSIAVEIGCGS